MNRTTQTSQATISQAIELAGAGGTLDIETVRAEILSGAVSDLATTELVLDKIERLTGYVRQTSAMAQRATGMPAVHHIVLSAVSNGTVHPRHIGQAVGLSLPAVTATLTVLESQELVKLERNPKGRILAVAVAPLGQAILAQGEAVRLRAVDALIQVAGPEVTGDVIQFLDGAIEAVQRFGPITAADS